MPEKQSWKFKRKGQKSFSFPPFSADKTELSILPCWLHSEYLWHLWISLKSLTNIHHGIQQTLMGSEFPFCRLLLCFHGVTDWFETLNFISFQPATGRNTFQVFVWVDLWHFQHLWILFGFYLPVGAGTGWFWVSQILSPVCNSSGISSVTGTAWSWPSFFQATTNRGSFLKAEERELHLNLK